jgi:hypothetical protein
MHTKQRENKGKTKENYNNPIYIMPAVQQSKKQYVDVFGARGSASRSAELFVGVKYIVVVEVNPTTSNLQIIINK